MEKRNFAIVALLTILFMNVFLLQIASHGRPPEPPRPPFNWDFDDEQLEKLRISLPYFLMVKTVFAALNSILLLSLMIIYLGIYRKTGAKFSLGLVIFSIALFLYTLSSNPGIYMLIGFRRLGFGPLFMFPELLTCIASAVLLYLSRQ